MFEILEALRSNFMLFLVSNYNKFNSIRLLQINSLFPLSGLRHICMWAGGPFPLFHYKIG